MQLPCSHQTRAGTPCQAPALTGTNPPACINHDPCPATRRLKRAAVKKGGQQVWAKQRALTQDMGSRERIIRPSLDLIEHALSSAETSWEELNDLLIAKGLLEEYINAGHSRDAIRALRAAHEILQRSY